MTRVTPLIMCGGAGTRLWPASRESAPKQFINLLGATSTFQDTLTRVSDSSLYDPPVVITNLEYQYMVADQVAAVGARATILLEPTRQDSGPAIAAATALIAESNPHAIILVLAADHVVRDAEAFSIAVRAAAKAAERGAIVTFGVRPDHPSTAYGYLRPGTSTEDAEILTLEEFVEKPDALHAEEYVAAGYLWNSGNFLFRANAMLDEYATFDPETVRATGQSVADAARDNDFIFLEKESFSSATPMSIDFAVMEKTGRASVLPISVGWSDVGSWHAVWELAEKDELGNAAHGDAVFKDAHNNFVSSEHLVCLVGVSNLAVIQTRDATLVFDREKGESVRPLVKELKARRRTEVDTHTEVYRPWGSYERLDLGDRFQVKRIVVKPGGRLSLQKHFHRAEHWIVVRGTALVTIGDTEMLLRENESTYIPLGSIHRLENPGKIPLEMIEVQSGSYLGEDDIVRLKDVYNRS